ncbi:MAG: DUF2953 domain-containing protein [Lachnospiraceae bacterium]|nr:DUF2953 domain-containing protein [Lachnospiraceae bacterium]
MGIVLTILKILGIILLVLLCLVLLILLIVLFNPISYSVEADFDVDSEEKVHATAKIAWFFHILSVLLHVNGLEDKSLKIKVFGITIMDVFHPKEKKERKKKTAGTKKDDAQTVYYDAAKDDPLTEAGADQTDAEAEVAEDQTDAEAEAAEGQTADEAENVGDPSETAGADETLSYEEQVKRKSLDYKLDRLEEKLAAIFEKVSAFLQKIGDFFDKTDEKLDKIEDKALYANCWLRVLEHETTQNALAMGKDDLIVLFKGILPREWQAYLRLGTGDPGSTGQIYGYYWMFIALYFGHFVMEPDFENKVTCGTIQAEGKIYLYRIVRIGLKVLLKKEYKYLLKIKDRVDALYRKKKGIADPVKKKKKAGKKKKAA